MKHRIVFIVTCLLMITAGFTLQGSAFLWLALIGIALAFIVLVVLGSAGIRLNYFVRSVNTLPHKDGILLTFDDGPDEQFTLQVADLLGRERISAVFFVIGRKADQHPQIVKALHDRGHIIGNHSYSHDRTLPWYRDAQLASDLGQCSDVIKRITGRPPLLFRPPFGVTTPVYERVLHRLGLVSAGWTVRSFDTVIDDPERLLARITRSVKPGSILLLHDTREVTLRVLPLLIDYCRANGIKIVSLQQETELHGGR